MNFSDIVGQKDVIAGLKNSIMHDRVGHACIFKGPEGIGKKTVAVAYAAMLLCENPTAAGSCTECVPCQLFLNGSNPDYHYIGLEGSSISIDEVRKLQNDIIKRPTYSSRKVYLIADADNMTTQAQNCLLKVLEEPPKYAVIVLTASNYDALLPTIRSRALKIAFRKNTFEEVRGLLQSRFGNTPKAIDFIASYSEGLIGTALELAASEEFTALREKTMELALRLLESRLADVFDIYDFFEANKNSVDTIIDIMVLFYRDILIAKRTGEEKILINSDKKDIILSNVYRFSLQKLMENISIAEQTRQSIKQNVNYQLSIEVMLMKLQQ